MTWQVANPFRTRLLFSNAFICRYGRIVKRASLRMHPPSTSLFNQLTKLLSWIVIARTGCIILMNWEVRTAAACLAMYYTTNDSVEPPDNCILQAHFLFRTSASKVWHTDAKPLCLNFQVSDSLDEIWRHHDRHSLVVLLIVISSYKL